MWNFWHRNTRSLFFFFFPPCFFLIFFLVLVLVCFVNRSPTTSPTSQLPSHFFPFHVMYTDNGLICNKTMDHTLTLIPSGSHAYTQEVNHSRIIDTNKPKLLWWTLCVVFSFFHSILVPFTHNYYNCHFHRVQESYIFIYHRDQPINSSELIKLIHCLAG